MRALGVLHQGQFRDCAARGRARRSEVFRTARRSKLAMVEQFWYLAWAAANGPMSGRGRPVPAAPWILPRRATTPASMGTRTTRWRGSKRREDGSIIARELAEHALAVFEDTGMSSRRGTRSVAARSSFWQAMRSAPSGSYVELRACSRPCRTSPSWRTPRPARVAARGAGAVSRRPRRGRAGPRLVAEGSADPARAMAGGASGCSPAVEIARAEPLAREAVALAEQTDFLELQGDCLVALGGRAALRGSGRGGDAMASRAGARALRAQGQRRPRRENAHAPGGSHLGAVAGRA